MKRDENTDNNARLSEIDGKSSDIKDTTEEMPVDDALRSLNVRYRRILSAVPEIIMEVDSNKIYTWANKTGYEFFGDDVIGKEAAYYFEGEQETYNMVQPIFYGSQETVYVESWQRRKDGERRLLAWWCSNLKDPEGNVTGALSSARDITEIKRMEEKLYNSEKYLKTIIDSSLDGIAVVDEPGKFEFVNNSFLRIIEWPEEEIIGQFFMKMIPEDTRDFVIGHWQRIQIDHGGLHEIKIKTRSGEIRFLNVSSSLMEINGKNKIVAIIHDITKNKKQEISLKESEERYKGLFENASDCIYTIKLDGQFLTANERVAKAMMCESTEEVLASNMFRWMTQESLEKVNKFMKEVITEEDYYNKSVVIEIIRKDGEHVWFEHKARPLKDENGTIVGLHGIGRDITEKNRLEEKLKASEALYKDLFENADDPMYTHDLKGNILSINKIALKYLGVTEEEAIGSNIAQWLTPESYKKFEERVRKIFMKEPLEPTVAIEVINKRGEHKWGEARTRLIKDGNRIIAVHGIIRDITEKMRLELELRESEEKYRDLFENAQDAMYVLDTEGNFIKMNNAGLNILRCKKEELIGSNISRWITPASMEIINDRRKKRLSGDKVEQAVIIEIVCKTGEHRWVEIKTREIKDGDKTIEIHGIARDITENRLLKQELKRSNKHKKLLCYLIQGTRGGKTRALILKHLGDRSFNANQLATALNMDYKTIRHHLDVLVKNGIIRKDTDGYSELYYIQNNIEFDLK